MDRRESTSTTASMRGRAQDRGRFSGDLFDDRCVANRAHRAEKWMPVFADADLRFRPDDALVK
jgi:hypothetical protein